MNLKTWYWALEEKLERATVILDYYKLGILEALGLFKNGGVVTLSGFRVHFAHIGQLRQLFRQIFVERTYYMQLENREPVILDAGANVGLATLYFSKMAPTARIIAIEAHPQGFELLKKNVEQNRLRNVEARHATVGDTAEPVNLFFGANAPAGDIGPSAVKQMVAAAHGAGAVDSVQVPGIRLSSLLDGPVDLVKLDIEANEGTVMRDLEHRIAEVRHFIIEYHYDFLWTSNRLSPILSLLERNGHIYRILSPRSRKLTKKHNMMIYTRNDGPAPEETQELRRVAKNFVGWAERR